jgi:predicted RNA binding protein YcfA (HicA-like mRNA interferase family)
LPKLKILSGKQVCDILTLNGFIEVRRRGSHIIMQKRIEEDTATVPVPNHKELKTGTLLSIIRQSGISRNQFEN